MKLSTLQIEYEAVINASAAPMVSLPGTVNTADTPSTIGVKKRRELETIIIRFVKTIALLTKLKLPPRALRGILGSLVERKKEQ